MTNGGKVVPIHWTSAPALGAPEHPGPRPKKADDVVRWEDAMEAWRVAQFDRLADELQMTDGTKTTPPRPIENTSNAEAILRHHPDVMRCVAFNELTRAPHLMEPVPGSRDAANAAAFEPRPLSDADVVRLQTWMQKQNMPRVGKQSVFDAVTAVAREATFDPLQDYVERCGDAWDGTRRIEHLFRDYFVAKEPNAYTLWLGEVFMMTLVHRALEPGAFQKLVVILEGQQDLGKSSALQALCPEPEWFGDDLPPLDSKDAKSYLRGLWLVEISELAATGKAAIEVQKSFLTRRQERFRAAYARLEETEPRRCAFVGTTNDTDYLKDPTGNTRFYPVELARVDIAAIVRDRDQLIGEAVIALIDAKEDGLEWWKPPAEAVPILKALRKEKQEVDPWLEPVARIIEGLPEVTTRMILGEGVSVRLPDGKQLHRRGLGFADAQQTSGLTRRMAKVLRALGWREDGQMPHNHRFARARRYVPPEVGTE